MPAGDKSTGSFEADGSSLLVLTYSLEPADKQAAVTDPVTGDILPPPPAAATGSSSAGAEEASELQSSSAFSIPAAPAAAAADAVAAGRVMSMRLPFWLEFPSNAPAAVACLIATLLGPFSGRLGQPLILTWQLARTGPNRGLGLTAGSDNDMTDGVTSGFSGFSSISLSEDVGGSVGCRSVTGRFSREYPDEGLSTAQMEDYDDLLLYDVTPGYNKALGLGVGSQGDLLRSSLQGSGAPRAGQGTAAQTLNRAQTLNPGEGLPWWQGCNPTGSVRLGRAVGSLATVEVVLVPQIAGRQVAPQLLLRSFGGNQPLVVERGAAGSDDEAVLYIQP